MCKFSNRGSIRCSEYIGAHPSLADNPRVKSVSQGLVNIKGKGNMLVYDVHSTCGTALEEDARTRAHIDIHTDMHALREEATREESEDCQRVHTHTHTPTEMLMNLRGVQTCSKTRADVRGKVQERERGGGGGGGEERVTAYADSVSAVSPQECVRTHEAGRTNSATPQDLHPSVNRGISGTIGTPRPEAGRPREAMSPQEAVRTNLATPQDWHRSRRESQLRVGSDVRCVIGSDVRSHAHGSLGGMFPVDFLKFLLALQHTATFCNILQHTATHCKVLQHTATHWNAL